MQINIDHDESARANVGRVFASHFGRTPTVVVRAPGRVNLIGGHTDYNDGFVLPIAIEQATWLACAERQDRNVELVSTSLGTATLHLDRLVRSGSWSDYVAGTLSMLVQSLDFGFDAVIHTELPVGAGLSSSAALELAVARAASDLVGTRWVALDAALMAQRAEVEFVGVPCGLMDQLVVSLAQAGHALLIDCQTTDVTPVPISQDAAIVLLDTGTRRRLGESRYRKRRVECEAAAVSLGVASLRRVEVSDLDLAPLDPVAKKRARHVITENRRVIAAAAAMGRGDLHKVGWLMNESHRSLRDDFEVSADPLDRMVETAQAHPAAYGARMTGGGFAGCCVALVDQSGVDTFCEDLRADSSKTTKAAAFPTRAAEAVALYPW